MRNKILIIIYTIGFNDRLFHHVSHQTCWTNIQFPNNQATSRFFSQGGADDPPWLRQMEIFDVFRLNGVENYPAAGKHFLENVILKVSQTHFSKDFYPKLKGGGGGGGGL